MTTISFYINENTFAYDTEILNENSKSIYSEGIYGDIYRIEKDSKRIFKNKKYIGTALTIGVN